MIARNRVTTQAQILGLLEAEGITMTQATLSRDLRDIGATKRDGRYGVPSEGPTIRSRRRRLVTGLTRMVVDARATGPLVVVTTPHGMAQAVALELSSGPLTEVLGTIAGVDTVFVAAESPGRARTLARALAARTSRAG